MEDKDPHADDEKLLTARNLFAAAVLLLFCGQIILPYWVHVPEGRTGDLIANGAKVVETIMTLILGYYFGDSQARGRGERALAKSVAANATLAETAQTAGAALASTTAPTSDTVTLAPGETATVQAAPAGDTGELPADQRVAP